MTTAPHAWEAHGPYGNLLRTFTHRDQATDYQSRMATIGAVVTIKRIITQRRSAA